MPGCVKGANPADSVVVSFVTATNVRVDHIVDYRGEYRDRDGSDRAERFRDRQRSSMPELTAIDA